MGLSLVRTDRSYVTAILAISTGNKSGTATDGGAGEGGGGGAGETQEEKRGESGTSSRWGPASDSSFVARGSVVTATEYYSGLNGVNKALA